MHKKFLVEHKHLEHGCTIKYNIGNSRTLHINNIYTFICRGTRTYQLEP